MSAPTQSGSEQSSSVHAQAPSTRTVSARAASTRAASAAGHSNLPVIAPLIEIPLDPKDRLPELENWLKTEPVEQHINIQALIDDIKAGIPVARFYQHGRRIDWDDIDWTKYFLPGGPGSALAASTIYQPTAAHRTGQMQQ